MVNIDSRMVVILAIWNESKVLSATAAIMLLDFLLTLVGLAVDPRVIGGAPAWMKPAKFALSTAIFAASIAWIFRYLPNFAAMKRWVGPALAIILVLEVGIIDLQAARGTTSHFNVSTPQNGMLFAIMGGSIGILWLLSVRILIALFRQPFKDPVWAWTLRLAMLISILGSASGGLMTIPTSDQRAEMARHEHVNAAGAHTVGAPDGGPGMAVVGWSSEHGDLRIPHFLGLHALQLIPLLVWWRRKNTLRFVFATSGSYVALFLLLTWQALRGESIAEPSSLTLMALGIWLVATLIAVFPFKQNGCTMEALHER